MLTVDQQLVELNRIVIMCKGTKLEGKEYLCVKFYSSSTGRWASYSNMKDFENIGYQITASKVDRIFAIALVEDTPIFLEEPFALTHKEYYGKFVYNKTKNSLDTEEPITQGFIRMRLSMQLAQVKWSEFKFYKEVINEELSSDYIERSNNTTANIRQVGGNHYKDKAIQPWAYMEANFPKEQFIGFLRGNIHKYSDRYKDKNDVEDLEKAMHYLEKLIEVESK